jgi:hypothetical protein
MAEKRTKLEIKLAELEACIGECLERLVEVKHLALQENPTRDLIARWCEAWKKRYRDDYVVEKQDAGQLKRLGNTLGHEELGNRLRRYVNDVNPWLMKQRHPLSVFYKQVNAYGSSSEDLAGDDAAPVGCSHSPACKSDQEHTKRKMQEARA